MLLLCKIHGRPAAIVGYGPGEKGQPRAIVVMDGGLKAIRLDEVELPKLPKALRRKLKRRQEQAEPIDILASLGVKDGEQEVRN